MVEVFERRAREPTGPIKAPRTYPGPASSFDRVTRLHSRPRQRLRLFRVPLKDDLLVSELLSLLDRYSPRKSSRDYSILDLLDRLEIELLVRTDRKRAAVRRLEDRSDLAHVGRACQPDRERVEQEEIEKKTEEVKWCREETVVRERGVLSAKLKVRLEPRKGSVQRNETGERNVAKRRHGRPCGQQSMDEINGHCPQGEKASRLGLCRCRRFRCSGLCDYWQQRPDAQSFTFYNIVDAVANILQGNVIDTLVPEGPEISDESTCNVSTMS
nr:PREDICTED: uncharacterized protein LOC105664196 [Megachile rotundata]